MRLSRKELILTSVLYANCGSLLPLFIGLLIDAKKSLKRLAFTQKSERNILLTRKEGIDGIFLLYKNWFNIGKCVLGAALGLLSLLVILTIE